MDPVPKMDVEGKLNGNTSGLQSNLLRISRRLSPAERETLATEIRDFLIQTLSKTGGHLGPNLGVVELTMALHIVFDTPEDKIPFDVSHQAYVHKILTGRRDRFATIRQPGGLNGFMLRTESEHDAYGAGHAGTALSAALGMAVARDLAGGKKHVIAVAGDAAFTNGITFEALNNIAAQTKRLIVVLNDNEWSIDRNVGADGPLLPPHRHQRALPASARLEPARLLERFGGKTAIKVVRRAEEAAKSMLWPSILFEEFGLEYFGPIDGHNLPLLVETFKFLKTDEPPRPAPRPHAKRPRLSACARWPEEVPRPRPLRSGNRQDS